MLTVFSETKLWWHCVLFALLEIKISGYLLLNAPLLNNYLFGTKKVLGFLISDTKLLDQIKKMHRLNWEMKKAFFL